MAAKSEEMLGFSAGNRGLLESRFRGPEHIGGRPAIPRRRRGLVTRTLVVANLTASGALRQNPQMPSLIERASSGRAKCRTCGQAIARGQERFGEALPSAYGEGESLFWFHLTCAACSRPESLLPALAQSQLPPEERERLTRLAQEHLFVAVEGIDDQVQDLAHFGFERMGGGFAHGSSRVTASKLVTLPGLSTRAEYSS